VVALEYQAAPERLTAIAAAPDFLDFGQRQVELGGDRKKVHDIPGVAIEVILGAVHCNFLSVDGRGETVHHILLWLFAPPLFYLKPGGCQAVILQAVPSIFYH
jgi:hypothetical protein